MKIKYTVLYGLLTNLVLSSLYLASCPEPTPPLSNQQDSTLTLMIYADNNGASEWSGFKLVKHLEKATIPWKITVLALVNFSLSNGDPWDATRLYKITYDDDGSETQLASMQQALPALNLDLSEDTVLDMASPETLESFIDFSKSTNYSDGYGLVVLSQNFAGGTLSGTQNTPGMSYAEFSTVLEGKSLDFVSLDGYSDGGMEFLYELKDSDVWVVTSSENESNWNYISLFQIVREYGGRKEFLSALKDTADQTHEIMIYDPKEIGNLVNALDELIRTVESNGLMTSEEEIENMRKLVLSCDSYDYESHRYVEISSLLEGFKNAYPELAPMTNPVKSALELLEVGESENPKMTIYLCDGDSEAGYGTLGAAYRSDGTGEKAGSVVGTSRWYGNRESQSGFLYNLWESSLEIYKEGKLTILVYINADSDSAAWADIDLNEMEAANYGKDINVVALVDMGEGNSGIWEHGRLYEIAHDAEGINRSLVSVQRPSTELGLPAAGSAPLDMSSKETLRNFISFAQRRYRSDDYGLVIAAENFSGGTLYPGGRLSEMSYEDLAWALAGKDIAFIGLEGSSGANLEILYELKDSGAMVAASPGVQEDWDYHALFDGQSYASGREDFLDHLTASAAKAGAVSLYALEDMEALVSSLDDLADAVWQEVDNDEEQNELQDFFLGLPSHEFARHRQIEIDSLLGELVNEYPQFTAKAQQAEDSLRDIDPKSSALPKMTIYLCDGDSEVGYGTLGAAYRSDGTGEKAGSVVGTSRWYGDRESQSGFLYNLWESSLEIYKEGKLTILVYMAADNDLAPMADVDINEMEAANYGEDVNAVVLADMGEGNSGVWDNGRLYEIAHDADGINRNLVSIQRPSIELGLPESGSASLDMSSKKTLRRFIAYVKQHYRSDEYALVIWGHGSGWRSSGSPSSRALAVDGDEMMTTAEFGEGIEGFDLSFVGFDLCFGAVFEMAWEIRNHARFMAGSQGLIPAAGWDYSQAFNIGTAYSDPKSFLSHLHQNVKNAVDNFWVYDLSMVEPVKEAFNSLASEWEAAIDSTIDQGSWQSFLISKVVSDGEAGSSGAPGIWNVDMRDMVQKLTAEGYITHTAGLVSRFNTQFNNLIIEGYGTENHGVSLYLCDTDDRFNPALVDSDYFKDSTGGNIPDFVLNSPWAPDNTNQSGFLYKLWYKSW